MEVNNGGLKTQFVDFQLLAKSGGMENKLKIILQENAKSPVVNNPIVENISLTGVRDFIKEVLKDALTLLLVH